MKLVAGLMVLAAAIAVIVAIGAVTRESGADRSTGSAEIVMEDLRFTPNQLDAKVGVPLRVRITNRDVERHDLNFPSLHMPRFQGVESILEPGVSRIITLRFDEAGPPSFICSLPRHAAAGMTGAVFVRP